MTSYKDGDTFHTDSLMLFSTMGSDWKWHNKPNCWHWENSVTASHRTWQDWSGKIRSEIWSNSSCCSDLLKPPTILQSLINTSNADQPTVWTGRNAEWNLCGWSAEKNRIRLHKKKQSKNPSSSPSPRRIRKKKTSNDFHMDPLRVNWTKNPKNKKP